MQTLGLPANHYHSHTSFYTSTLINKQHTHAHERERERERKGFDLDRLDQAHAVSRKRITTGRRYYKTKQKTSQLSTFDLIAITKKKTRNPDLCVVVPVLLMCLHYFSKTTNIIIINVKQY
jgi:uncharacterized membrane protein YjjP (DUF1212 family)